MLKCRGRGYIQRNEKRSQIIRSSTPAKLLLYHPEQEHKITNSQSKPSNTNQNSSQEKSWSVFLGAACVGEWGFSTRRYAVAPPTAGPGVLRFANGVGDARGRSMAAGKGWASTMLGLG